MALIEWIEKLHCLSAGLQTYIFRQMFYLIALFSLLLAKCTQPVHVNAFFSKIQGPLVLSANSAICSNLYS